MSETIIEIENMSKQYRLGEVSTGTVSHDLNRLWHRLRGKPDPYLMVTQPNDRTQQSAIGNRQSAMDFVWALRDINLTVRRGEVMGIIGRNGAGKSTLLKVLSRVTAPTTGEIRVGGRIASLLEVGTGFHHELTGRENIFLNGAILGMSKAEIRRKLDEIVEFSGCARYLDTPAKRYSSGMIVRLGFAIAAHLEPDILIVDEVLAVGDVEFQKKCIGKMQDVAGHGRTVLFVSHNMSAVQKLCPRSIILQDGELACEPTPTVDVIRRYLQSGPSRSKEPITFDHDIFHLEDFRLLDANGEPVVDSVPHDQPCLVEITFRLDRCDPAFNVGYTLYGQNGEPLFTSLSTDTEESAWPPLREGRNCLRSMIPGWLLNEGDYSLHLLSSLHCAQWLVHPEKDGVRIPLSVRMGAGKSPYWHGRRDGAMAPLLAWNQQPIETETP